MVVPALVVSCSRSSNREWINCAVLSIFDITASVPLSGMKKKLLSNESESLKNRCSSGDTRQYTFMSMLNRRRELSRWQKITSLFSLIRFEKT